MLFFDCERSINRLLLRALAFSTNIVSSFPSEFVLNLRRRFRLADNEGTNIFSCLASSSHFNCFECAASVFLISGLSLQLNVCLG